MKKTLLLTIVCFLLFQTNAQEKVKSSSILKKEEVKKIMQKVADWQMHEKLKHHSADWTNAALYAGFVEWAKLSNEEKYFDYLKDKGTQNNWTYLIRKNTDWKYFADDYAVGQLYVELYRKFKEKKMIAPMEVYLDSILKHPSTRSLKFTWDKGSYPTQRWSWCDALFMGPTVWAKMGATLNKKEYLNFMHQEYRTTYEYLYDKEEALFFRDDRYFEKKETNGEKVFWGRGNGWVLAGLPIILKELPNNWKHKEFYENLFIEMAEKITSLQDKNGYWHTSLLDSKSYPNPETSCSAFFTYAITWGVNNGYLKSRKYKCAAKKGWKALVKAVSENGKLGWVQPVGQDPKSVTKEMTEVYGVGGFLLAGSEIYKMVDK